MFSYLLEENTLILYHIYDTTYRAQHDYSNLVDGNGVMMFDDVKMVNPKLTSSSSSTLPPVSNHSSSSSTKTLQDRIHDLVTRISNTIEHVKNWPADSNDTTIHTERAKLITFIRDTVSSLQRVEQCVKNDVGLRQSLQNCRIPLDLLDLLDTEINPDCFSRGLLREAMAQLAGLRRRKNALEMLASAVQKGIDQNNNNNKTNPNNETKQQQQGEDSVTNNNMQQQQEPKQQKTKKKRTREDNINPIADGKLHNNDESQLFVGSNKKSKPEL
jgi:Transcription factor subunit Med10 of Mediator complex